uniref:Sugar transport protein 5 n=1 Tax=Anthurium amnicola TaxID=1678845 RepID=A0A1D1XH94_9ARAE
MAGGGFADAGPAVDYGGAAVTASVIITCVMAASGGLIFGYDIGISGGVTTMKPFLAKFFPGVLRRMAAARRDQYCVFDSQALTAFTSSLYVSGLASSLLAGGVTRGVGRRAVMLAGGAAFLAGAVVNAAATNVAMLILGRLLLGVGVGFANQATPVYLAETAPARWRGAFNTGFQLSIGVGVLVANLINYAANRVRGGWGWRLSLGLAAAPAAVLLLGALLISDTPSSLAARGRLNSARAVLRRTRGREADVEAELGGIVLSLEASRRWEGKGEAGGPFRRLLGRRYRHHLVMAVAIPFFQQLTGINVIAFYSPVLFQAVGFGSNSALMAAVILAAVNLGSILVSTCIVDRYGRRVLFLQGGFQMFLCQVAVAWVLGAKVGGDGTAVLPKGWALAVLVLMCVYAAGFGWSWGPLSWLVPSEIFPVEVRSAGQGVAVAVNLAVSFVQAQLFLAVLCRLKYGVFLFYAGWIAVMTAFVAAFVPETKGVPLESMEAVWAAHWYWRRFAEPSGSPGRHTSGLIAPPIRS